jgi:hypothetical protein
MPDDSTNELSKEEIEKIIKMTDEEKQDYMWRLVFSWNMTELLRLKNLTNTLYKEDSVYNGGTIRYIPKANWDWVWEDKFLYKISKLGDKSKCDEDEEHDTKCEECQQPTVDEEDRLCHKCYHASCDEGECWCSCYCDN